MFLADDDDIIMIPILILNFKYFWSPKNCKIIKTLNINIKTIFSWYDIIIQIQFQLVFLYENARQYVILLTVAEIIYINKSLNCNIWEKKVQQKYADNELKWWSHGLSVLYGYFGSFKWVLGILKKMKFLFD